MNCRRLGGGDDSFINIIHQLKKGNLSFVVQGELRLLREGCGSSDPDPAATYTETRIEEKVS
jgi:hypothetical protein